MLVCKIEMWPGGDETRKREIGRVLIANVGGDRSVGNYKVTLPKSGEYAKRPGIWKSGSVLGFPRLRLGPHDLLLRALIACVGDRSKTAVAQTPDLELGDDVDAEATQ